MGLGLRLASGTHHRRSRLHDEKGNLAPWHELARLPAVAAEVVTERLIGWRPERPLICRSAAHALGRLVGSEVTVVEFGAGHSTLWFAHRARQVLSFETERGWFERIDAARRTHGLDNIDLALWDGRTFPASLPGPESPRLFFIDGAARDACVEFVCARARSFDAVCLDNTDKDSAPGAESGEMRRAERRLIEFARADRRPMRYFTGFAPGHLYAEQTLIVFPSPNPPTL